MYILRVRLFRVRPLDARRQYLQCIRWSTPIRAVADVSHMQCRSVSSRCRRVSLCFVVAGVLYVFAISPTCYAIAIAMRFFRRRFVFLQACWRIFCSHRECFNKCVILGCSETDAKFVWFCSFCLDMCRFQDSGLVAKISYVLHCFYEKKHRKQLNTI